MKRHWPFLTVVLQLVWIAVLTGYLAADMIFPTAVDDGGGKTAAASP